MENIEQKIKERLMHVAPSRELFDKTMNQVTKNNLNRNTILEGEAPSPYQSQFSNIMKKITFIGVPAIAFAVFAIFFISGNTPTDIPGVKPEENPKMAQINLNALDGKEVIPNTIALKNDATDQTEFQIDAIQDTDSLDDILNGIVNEAEMDATYAINDIDDAAYINAELESYNSINSTTYENIL